MFRILVHLSLVGPLCIIFVCADRITHVESELRDLVTQRSVVERVGMAAVIKDFRDGSIVTVEWPTLVDIASSLDRASEQLLWSTYVLQLRVSHNDVMNCGCVAQTRAAQAVQAAMNQVSNARDRLSSLTEKEED